MTTKTEIIISAVDKTQQAVQSAQRGMAGLGSAANSVASVLSRFGIAAPLTIGAMAGAAISAANSTARYAQEMTNLSNVAGASVEQFSAMSWAAERHGVSAEKLADIYKDVQDKVGDFIQTGGGAMKDFFENIAPRVGVTADEFRRLSGPEALQLYYSSLEKANLSQSDLVFYMEAIASDTTALIPLLQNGGAEFARLSDEARSLGVVMDDISAKKAKEFADNMVKIEGAAQGLRIEIGNELIPKLNELAERFLDASREGLTFSEKMAAVVFGTGKSSPLNEDVTRRQVEQLKIRIKSLKNEGSDFSGEQAQLERLERRLAFAERARQIEYNRTALAGFDEPGYVPYGSKSKNKPEKTDGNKGRGGAAVKAPQDYDAILAERVANAINNTDLVKAQELADTLAKLDQLAVAGLDPAIVKAVRDDLNGALGEAAKRYKEMADPLQKYRDQLEEINALHQAGELTLEEAMAAEGEVRREIQRTTKAMKDKADAMDDLGSTSQNIDTVITNAFSGAADAIAEFAMGGKVSFGDMVSSMIRDLIRLEMQMNMTKAYNAAGGMSGIGKLIDGLFGNVTTAFKYNTNVGSQQTSMLAAQDAVFNAKGNVYRSPSLSAYSGQVYNSPQVFAFAKGAGIFAEAGPEAIMPLQRDSRGRLGVSAAGGGASLESVRVEIRNEGTPQEVSRAQPRFDAEGLIVEVFTRDIANEGPMAKSMQSRFGLSRAAGAFA